ncbi:MAG: sugar phosphate nucleotidyltransferase [Longimicrobiales bacterium]
MDGAGALVLSRALIPAAGRGRRAYPRSSDVPKVLLEVDGKPLIVRNIEMLRDRLGIRDFTVIIGYLGEQVRARLRDGSELGVAIRFVNCADVDRGLATGMMQAKPALSGPFVTVLGDEVYLRSNHDGLALVSENGFDAICGVVTGARPDLIRGNYAVEIDGDRITRLVEKPADVKTGYLGCGTYVFTPEIFDTIERTPRSSRTGRVELTDAIDRLAQQGKRVLPFFLEGTYVNINSVDDHNYAQYVARAAHFPDFTISVVIPAYNEEQSIGYVVRDFAPLVDEVFVVDNGSADRTAEVAREAGARVETVALDGYGETIRYGLARAQGDILVVTEADHSFRARDLGKLLEYLKDADFVIGTRTTRELIEQGTNMRGPVRLGNIAVAKLVETLWWQRRARFTDVGCTFRALWRDSYARMEPYLHGVGPELSPEMMVAALRAGQRVIEVPVSYHRRIAGDSKHSANYVAIGRTALRMLRTIARHRLRPRQLERAAP